ERNRADDVARRRELVAQQLDRVRLVEDLRLEVSPGRQVEVGVRWPRVAIDAAVLAAAVRIDRLTEADVGRLVARDDRARGVDVQLGARSCGNVAGLQRRVERIAVWLSFATREPAVLVRKRSSALDFHACRPRLSLRSAR